MPLPQANAVIIYMMDVSGSMGDEQKEIVRIEAFWIDTWLRSQYEGLETRYIIHDAVAREVDRETFFTPARVGRHDDRSRLQALRRASSSDDYPPSEWNIYPLPLLRRRQLAGDDTGRCVELLRERSCPPCNLFCYGQVESPYGTGQFIKDLRGALRRADENARSPREIDGKEAIVRLDQDVPGEGQVTRR